MSLGELNALCRRRGWRMTLELVDATLRPYRDENSTGGFLRVRVLDRAGQVLAGRCQSEPGLEQPDALAKGVLEILAKHGLVD